MNRCRLIRSAIYLTATSLMLAGMTAGHATDEVESESVPLHVNVHHTLPPPRLPSTCSDADGDGWSPDGGDCGLIDCDDLDPDVNPGAPEVCDGIDNDCDGAIETHFVDTSGTEYCYDFVFGEAIVGEPIPVRAYGYDSRGHVTLRLIPIDSGYTSGMRHDCYTSAYCVWDTVLPAHDYPGVYPVTGRLMRNLHNSYATFVQQMEVVCPDEYCEPEPLYADFVSWMRQKGYKESIVNQYADARLVTEAVEFRSDLRNRPMGITQPWVIDFYDLIPTDTEATYVGMAPGEGPDCTPTYNYPEYCVPVHSTDYLFVRDHYEKTFGIDFEFVYHRVEMDYTDVLGEPTLLSYGWYRFPFPYSYRDSFPRHAIVHLAMTSWLGAPIDGATTGAGAAFIQADISSLRVIEAFTHEWGHTFGMSHPWVGDYFAGEDWFWGFNSVMDNTYRTGPPGLFDVTDPYERYIFEPDDGYQDEGLYADAYNEYIVGSPQLPTPGFVEPVILGVAVLAETASEITYQITLGNTGNIAMSYVGLAAYDGDESGALIEERIIDRIEPGIDLLHNFTIAKSMLGSGAAAFVLNVDSAIVGFPFVCGDLDYDGTVNISDVLHLVSYAFKGGPAPLVAWIGDVNGMSDGTTAADIIYIINYIFKGGPGLVCPES